MQGHRADRLILLLLDRQCRLYLDAGLARFSPIGVLSAYVKTITILGDPIRAKFFASMSDSSHKMHHRPVLILMNLNERPRVITYRFSFFSLPRKV